MRDQLIGLDKTQSNSAYRPRKANECVTDPKKFIAPEPLFDEFWREGELALFFGAAGTGKSILAVQIADALARGCGLNGFQMPKKRRKVLYVDLNLSDAQFQTRYSRSADTLVRMSGTRTFPSATKTVRQPLSPQAAMRTRVSALRPAMRTSAFRFAENLYRDRPRSNDDLSEWLRGMILENGFQAVIIDDLSAVKNTHDGTRETLVLMRRLRKIRDDLNVSILVLTDAEVPREFVGEADLRRSRVLCSVADSVFAIGEHPRSNNKWCLIQTRSRGAAIFWERRNAPVCQVKRMESSLLGMEFDERFAPRIDEETRRLICQIVAMSDKGAGFRAIAMNLGISKSQVARLYKKWTPAMERETEEEELATKKRERTRNLIQEENADAEIDNEESDYWTDDTKPVTDEHEKTWIKASPQSREIDIEAIPWAAGLARKSVYDLPSGIDGYGRKIFIESRDKQTARPTIWYQFDKKGIKLRNERTGYGINVERLGASPYL